MQNLAVRGFACHSNVFGSGISRRDNLVVVVQRQQQIDLRRENVHAFVGQLLHACFQVSGLVLSIVAIERHFYFGRFQFRRELNAQMLVRCDELRRD